MQESPRSKKVHQSIGGLAISSLVTLIYLPLPVLAQTSDNAPDQPSGTITLQAPVEVIPLTPGTVPTQPPLQQTPPRTGLPSINSPRNGTPIQVEDGYTLGPGDRIRIDIFNVPEYSGENQVLADGSLNLPLIGSVPVRGMTLKQASAELEARYVRFLKRPVVTLNLIAARPIKIAVAGEVSRPGSYTAQGTGVPSLTQLIEQAGGITQSADLRQVEVRRPRPRSGGSEQVIKVDLWQLAQTGDLNQDLLLRDGDSVFIPATTEVNIAEATTTASFSFAANEALPIKIAVVGEVGRPGAYTMEGDAKAKVTTVTTAIQKAGGITQAANIRQIQVRRLTKAGSEQTLNVDLWALLKGGDLRQDVPLQEGDTVIIPTATQLTAAEITDLASSSFSPDKITINVVGEVVRPGAVQVPPNTPLNQALLAAGGFNNKANQGTVQLIRLNPNGTVAKNEIPVDFAQGVNEKSNPPLRNNDTVLVGKDGLVAFGESAGTILGPLLAPITGIFGLFNLLGF